MSDTPGIGAPRPRRIPWEAYAWLIYSLMFIGAAIALPFTLQQKTVMVVSFAIFLPLYFAGYLIRGPKILWIIAVFDVIAIVNTQWNPAAASFFIYGSAFIAYGFQTRTAIWVLGAQVLIATIAPFLQGMPWWYYMASTVISALIGALTIQARARDESNARLRLAQAEVERLAKLAERERIARDLHDLLGHTLSVVVLKSELAQKLMSRDPVRAAQEVAEVERIARQGLADVREAITGYRSSGLAAEIEHVRETLTAAGIETTIEARPIALAPAQESALSMALREAATNVIRHAAAKTCRIKFYSQDGSALMEVQDDGRGSDAPFGNGLSGMSERIHALGGVLVKETERGTRLLIRLPLRAES
jgi:two-component system sensor histidine kinase DesK